MYKKGHQKLWDWFGLSYASFLTIPRSFMHEMPDKWQSKMADLLNEYSDIFINLPDIKSYVIVRKSNKFSKIPDWILNYRNPNSEKIKECMKNEPVKN